MSFDGFTKVDSGHIKAVKYHQLEHKMTVRFQNGYEYDVHAFTPEHYREFMDAPSQGEHYHAEIKDNHPIVRVK